MVRLEYGDDGVQDRGRYNQPADRTQQQQQQQQLEPRMSQTPPPNQSWLAPIPGPPASPALSVGRRNPDLMPHGSQERARSKHDRGRSVSGTSRICNKCSEPMTGQYVRALEGTYHLECFRCRTCKKIVASKFFPVEDENGEQYPLCETDYFRRLNLLCHKCGGALRGSYITALDKKYHVDHFTCSMCPTIFGAQDSYYEHDGQVYCHFHYSTQFAQRCNGCQTAILKQFVEIFRNTQKQHWHPECYMIYKFWNVRLNPPETTSAHTPGSDDEAQRQQIRDEQDKMEDKVYKIWSVLSAFEESSAACISDMLLHVSNGAYLEGVFVAKKFIWHVDIVFQGADKLDAIMVRLDLKGLSYSREAKLLCKKIVALFSLLSKSPDGSAKIGITQNLLTLVTGLAHYLKLLIRICLQGALRIEKDRQTPEGLSELLATVRNLDAPKNEDMTRLQLTSGLDRLSANDSDQCTLCQKSIEDECVKNDDKRWHILCMRCRHCGKELGRDLQDARLNIFDSMVFCAICETHGSDRSAFEHVSKLQQFIFLLKVALARLLERLRNHGAIPNALGNFQVNSYQRLDDHELRGRGGDGMATRSKSVSGDGHHRESSYESSLANVRRLRSTRYNEHLSTSFRKARRSRIIQDPDGTFQQTGAEPGTADGGIRHPRFSIVEDKVNEEGQTDLSMTTNQDALTLDDIPRIAAAEQAREQRSLHPPRPDGEPAASDQGYARRHSTDASAVDFARAPSEPGFLSLRDVGRRYFSELPALEYFIVRHVAVMSMHPMVEHEFTLEELLSLIESKKSRNFWNNLGKAFRPADGKKNVKKKGVFGVPIELILERDGAESTDGVGPGTLRVPAVVDDIISTMRQMDLSVEGVFRKNGNIKKLTELVEAIDKEGSDKVNLSGLPVVQVAALLKRYLRDMPDPLMTFKLYRLWMTAAKIPDLDKRRHCLHLTCCLLPKPHRDLLEVLFCFLKWAGSFHQVDDESGSKMDIRNLSTVIAPNILCTEARATTLDSNHIYPIEAVEVIMTHIEEMCLVPDEIVEVLSDQSLLNSDITTKEILKRLADRQANGANPRTVSDVNVVVGRHDNPTRPPARRVDTDPSSWRHETSVRPIQQETGEYQANGHGTSPVGASSLRFPIEEDQASPYRHDFDRREVSQSRERSRSQSRPWPSSGWNRQNSGLTAGTL